MPCPGIHRLSGQQGEGQDSSNNRFVGVIRHLSRKALGKACRRGTMVTSNQSRNQPISNHLLPLHQQGIHPATRICEEIWSNT